MTTGMASALRFSNNISTSIRDVCKIFEELPKDMEDCMKTLMSEEEYIYPITQEQSGLEIAEEMIAFKVIPAFCVVGLIGTLLTLVVLSIKSLKNSTNVYVMALACSDLLYIISSLSYWAYIRSVKVKASQEMGEFQVTTWAISSAQSLFTIICTWLTVLISLERYIAICHPMQVSKHCTLCKSRLLVVIVICIAIIAMIPILIIHEIKYEVIGQKKLLMLKIVEKLKPDKVGNYWGLIVEFGLVGVVPLLTIFITNMCIIVRLYHSHVAMTRNMPAGSRGRSLLSHEQKQLRITKVTIMLVLVIFVFVICFIPHFGFVCYARLSNKESPRYRQIYLLIKVISEATLALKASVNFILYCWFSERFRSTLKNIGKGCCKHLCKGHVKLRSQLYSQPTRSNSSRSTFV